MCRHPTTHASHQALLLAAAIALAIGCDSDNNTGNDAPPAHFEVNLTWGTDDDLDLVVIRTIPDDVIVDKDNPCPGGGECPASSGDCTHSGDDPGSATGGSETVICPAPAQTGWYVVEVDQPFPIPAEPPPLAELRINANGIVTTTQETVPTSVCSAGLRGDPCIDDTDCDTPSVAGICKVGVTRNVVLFFRN